VLDEPTFGQDAATWRELVTLLAEQRARGCAVAVVTHDADLVTTFADERIAL
jgi:ABC-type Mn2+/Zn2+ transport system ATPase subunit